MSSRKRPATEELQRPALTVRGPAVTGNLGGMGVVQSWFKSARNFFGSWLQSPAPLHLVEEVERQNADPRIGYKQTSQTRHGDSTTLKRQKTESLRSENSLRKTERVRPIRPGGHRTRSAGERHEAGTFRASHGSQPSNQRQQRDHERGRQRARSVGEGYRLSNKDKIHVRALRVEPQTREAVDNIWLPKQRGLLENLTFSQRHISSSFDAGSTPTSPSGIADDKRHSESSELPESHLSTSLYRETLLAPTSNPRKPRPFQITPSSRGNVQPEIKGASKAGDIDRRLKELLFDENDVLVDGPQLVPSSSKRALLEESRRQRELLQQEKLRLEKQKKLEAEAEARLKRRQPKKPLVQPLETLWDDQVSDAIYTNNESKVICTSIGGTELIPKDFRTLLQQRSWLNDEIINSYIEWIVDAANKLAPANPSVGKEKPVPKYIAHNSFFYDQITKKGPTSTDRLMKRKNAPGKSLMQVDTVIVPICRGAHWTVGVVRPAAKTIEYFDSFGERSRLSREFITHMRSWLQHQLGEVYVAGEWKEPDTGCASQSNGWDCGVFVCTNAFCVAFGLDTSCYVERDMELQRRRIAAVLINRGFHGDFSWSKGGW